MQQIRLNSRPDPATGGESGTSTGGQPGIAAPFRVLVTCTYFEPGFRGGGPGRSVAHILDAASPAVAPVLVTGDRDLGAERPYPGLSGRWVTRGRATVFYLPTRSPRQWFLLWRALRTTPFDLLYVNSLWAPMSLVPVLAVRLGLLRAGRVMVAPRGECSPGALSLKSVRKRLFVRGWRRVLRSLDPLFHASTAREADDVRRMFPWAVVRVNGNQSPLPPEPAAVPAPASGPLRMVFVGRIAPMKNLALALEALAAVRRPVLLDVYGPVEDPAYWRRCEHLMAGLPPEVRVAYRGVLPPAAVGATLGSYDLTVLPTLGENFGHVVAESLAASCPVLCSDRTPWTEVLDTGGGAVVTALTAPAWTAAIEGWAVRTPQQRHAARLAAGDAYRRWRATASGESVLDMARLAVRPDHETS